MKNLIPLPWSIAEQNWIDLFAPHSFYVQGHAGFRNGDTFSVYIENNWFQYHLIRGAPEEWHRQMQNQKSNTHIVTSQQINQFNDASLLWDDKFKNF